MLQNKMEIWGSFTNTESPSAGGARCSTKDISNPCSICDCAEATYADTRVEHGRDMMHTSSID